MSKQRDNGIILILIGGALAGIYLYESSKSNKNKNTGKNILTVKVLS
ncbi:MAG: hypothetical protein QXH07_06265 [Thermoplasmata archaeon]